MNEDLFEALYTLAQENGYADSSEDFITLLQDNSEARKAMYDISLSHGYRDSFDDFENLVKIDKKKIRTRLEERQKNLEEQSALMSENIFLESPGYADVKKRFEAGKFTSEEKKHTKSIQTQKYLLELARLISLYYQRKKMLMIVKTQFYSPSGLLLMKPTQMKRYLKY